MATKRANAQQEWQAAEDAAWEKVRVARSAWERAAAVERSAAQAYEAARVHALETEARAVLARAAVCEGRYSVQ